MHSFFRNFWISNYIECGSNCDKNRDLSLDEYLNKIESYLWNIIINLQNLNAWKVQLTIAINFISSKDAEEERLMHPNSNNIILTPYCDANDVIDKLFKSLCSKYQNTLETSMKGRNFIFDSAQLMYYKCHQVGFTRGGSLIDFIDYPGWMKKKAATKNSTNKDNKCV